MTRPSDNRLPYMPGIDALRAIAVLAVFFYHTGAGWMPGGFLGVDVFFVISGYLITALLLSEVRQRGHINVLAFWLRRARRLLPAVAVMIGVSMLIAAIFIPSDVDSLRGDALSSLFYINNWHLIFTHQSYFQSFGRPSLFRHLWSLSVEEQFYLLWPLVFAAGMTLFGRKRLLAGVIAGALASTLLMAILFDPHGSTDRIFYGTDTRAVGLLMGVALALVWHPNDLKKSARRGAGRLLDVIGIIAFALILSDFLNVHDFEPSLYQGGFLVLALITTALVAVLAHPAARFGRVLGNKPLVWLGLRSYSFYLWHWPILVLTRPHLDVPISGPILVILQLAATLVICDLSYRYIEQPFRHKLGTPNAPSWLRAGRWALAAGVAASVVIVGWSGIVSTSGGGGGVDLAQANGPTVVTNGSSTPPRKKNANAGVDAHKQGQKASDVKSSGVLAIGDSVMAGAATSLVNGLPGGHVVVNAQEGRQAYQYPAVIDAYRQSGQLPNTVVVQVGNNGPLYYDDLNNIKKSLAGVQHVYLVNVTVPRSWQDEANSELVSFAKSWPEAKILDWHDTVTSSETYDGIHLNPAGQAAYLKLIRNAVESGG